jgi:protein arginine kinase
MLSAWPEGRGVFLNADKSLCIFVNVEDHITVVCTEDQQGGASKARQVFKLATKVLKSLSQHMEFEFDRKLGFITPSPAKLGTALAFSLMVALPHEVDQEGLEKQFQVCVDKDQDGGHCIIYNKLSLGVSEVDCISEVVSSVKHVLTAST